MFQSAADIMLEAWYWMPYGLLVDLVAYHIVVRWLDSRPSRSSSRPPE